MRGRSRWWDTDQAAVSGGQWLWTGVECGLVTLTFSAALGSLHLSVNKSSVHIGVPLNSPLNYGTQIKHFKTVGSVLLCGTVLFISSRRILSILLVSAEVRAWTSCSLSWSWSCCWWFRLSARTRSSLRSENDDGQGRSIAKTKFLLYFILVLLFKLFCPAFSANQ